MIVLITGSKGYVGKNLTYYLLKKGLNVIPIDRKIGSEVEELTQQKLTSLGVNHIVHLSALSGIKSCSDNLKQAYHDNISSTLKIFNSAEETYIPVTFASSQAAKTPKANYYALTKYMAECEAEKINFKNKTNIKVLRFTNIYGGMDYLETKSTVISNFIKAKKENLPIKINGDGSQQRDFIHVEDICDAIFKSIVITNIKIDKPIDIGTGIATSIKKLAEIFNHKFTYDLKSSMIGTDRNVADTYNAYKLLGFKANINLNEQIRKEYF